MNLSRLVTLSALLAGLSACAADRAMEPDRYLADVGMFFVGGSAPADASQHADQALVHYFKANRLDAAPLVLYPGLGLSSYIFISTPDGRQGWAQQFALTGHPVYVYDPVETGPSGFPAAALQGNSPATVSSWDINQIWPRWGFGPERDKPHENVRFPVADIDQFYASLPPRLASAPISGNEKAPNRSAVRKASDKDVAALIALLEQIGPAVLIPHSMGGTSVFEVVRTRPELVKAVVVIEPVGCPRSADAVKSWTNVPFLAVYGDYVEQRGQTGRRDACRSTAQNLAAAGGNGTVLELTEVGVFGNTHLMMQDNNSAAIAARIETWLRENVR